MELRRDGGIELRSGGTVSPSGDRYEEDEPSVVNGDIIWWRRVSKYVGATLCPSDVYDSSM